MVYSVLRFNQVQARPDRADMADRYRATLEMASYADEHGVNGVSLEEHHGAENGWSPSPMMTAGMVLARTKAMTATLSALLLPLHDPVRVAEDIAVIDNAAPGRLVSIMGLGYRPEEYAAHGKSFADRGELLDEALDVLMKAWSGEPFEYRGTTVRVTPVPFTQPHPLVFVGGSAKVSARRAARLGLPFFPSAHLPELLDVYNSECEKHGTTPFAMMPGPRTELLFLSDDPDRTWAELGEFFMNEAATYAGWQTPDIRSAVHSHATTVQELRAEGIYRVLTPDECVESALAQGDAASLAVHPLVGGMPLDAGWSCVTLLCEKVLPRLAGPVPAGAA